VNGSWRAPYPRICGDIGANMKHLGILATTMEGAALCSRVFCQLGSIELGPHDHPDVTLDCIALARSLPAWERADYQSVRATLSESVQRLAKAGADFFACPDNTAHIALEQPGASLALPGLHIAEVVADQAARNGHTRVGLLGTKYTMDGPVYPRALAARKIAAELPATPDRAILHEIILAELVNGVFTENARQEYARIIERLAARGCDAVALVCTEIPLLVPADTSALPVLDSTRLLARATFDAATGRRTLPSWRGGPVADLRDRARYVPDRRIRHGHP
jgi:aspartate racemase